GRAGTVMANSRTRAGLPTEAPAARRSVTACARKSQRQNRHLQRRLKPSVMPRTEDAMRKCVLLFVVALLTTLPHHAGAQIRITRDMGGVMEAYIKRFQGWRDSGQQVWIDGTCLSACTLVLGIIPPNRICVTPRAVLGFHAAWNN